MNILNLIRKRSRLLSGAALFGLFLALVMAYIAGQGAELPSGRLGGDYPAFYSAGRIIREVGFSGLYEIKNQAIMQRDLFPDNSGFLSFPYPPFVAIPYAALSMFPYRISYLTYVFLNLAALYIVLKCLGKLASSLKGFFLESFAVSLTFYPMLKAVFGGQNSAITLMLIALVWRLTAENRQFAAGLALGLLIYKPQFAIPLIGLFFLSRRFKVGFYGVATAAGIVLVAALFTGFDSYLNWYNFLKWYIPIDANLHTASAVSWIGFADSVLGHGNKLSFWVGYSLCLVTVGIICTIWAVGGKEGDFNSQMALAAVCMVLIPPHALYYDTGLIVLTCAVFFDKNKKWGTMLVGFAWLFGFAQLFAERIGFSPIFFLVAITFILSLRLLVLQALGKVHFFEDKPI